MQTLTVAERVISQIFRDKRTIAMMFLAPLFVLFLSKLGENTPTSKRSG
ncbi:hypothetical protein [Exiguobacterium oxidotolerans]|nr:hypothetical protein [Exiguobacterium oxidotolerans]